MAKAKTATNEKVTSEQIMDMLRQKKAKIEVLCDRSLSEEDIFVIDGELYDLAKEEEVQELLEVIEAMVVSVEDEDVEEETDEEVTEEETDEEVTEEETDEEVTEELPEAWLSGSDNEAVSAE